MSLVVTKDMVRGGMCDIEWAMTLEIRGTKGVKKSNDDERR